MSSNSTLKYKISLGVWDFFSRCCLVRSLLLTINLEAIDDHTHTPKNLLDDLQKLIFLGFEKKFNLTNLNLREIKVLEGIFDEKRRIKRLGKTGKIRAHGMRFKFNNVPTDKWNKVENEMPKLILILN